MTDAEGKQPVTRAEAHRAHSLIIIGIGVLIAVMGVATFVGLKLVDDNSNRIDHNAIVFQTEQKAQTLATRRATYRICRRQMEIRAFLWKQAQVEAKEGHPLIDVNKLPEKLAIYDCTPDLYGQEARRLKRASMRRYVDHVAPTVRRTR